MEDKITEDKLISLGFKDISEGYYCMYKIEIEHPWKKAYNFKLKYIDKDHWIWIDSDIIVDLHNMNDLRNLYKGLFKKELKNGK